MSRLTLVKNAFANLCRGGAAAFVMILLPPCLTRVLSKDIYGTWLLILQLSTYVGLLDFGIQTAVGRYVSHHNELGEIRERNSIVSTALVILIGSSVFSMLGISILAWQLPNLFKDMPIELHQDAQLSLLCVGYSLAIALPFSVFGGIFIGLQKYDIPAWIIGTSKLTGGLFVVLIASATHNIVMMAVVMGMANIASGIWQYVAFNRINKDIKISKKGISKVAAKEISSYCFSLSVWTVAMIFVSGLDTVIIGYFDYQSVTYYSLASILTNVFVGLQSNLVAVIMPQAAHTGAKGDSEALGRLLILTTRYTTIIMLLTGLPLILLAEWFLAFWVGTDYAGHTATLLQLLLIGNFIRQLGYPYATISLAVGEQRQMIISPLIEGLINIIISVVITKYIGSIGVAIGTICGAFVSINMHFFQHLPNSKSIKLLNKSDLINPILISLISVIPSAIFIIVSKQSIYSWGITPSIFMILINWFLLWKYAIFNNEQRLIIKTIRTWILN